MAADFKPLHLQPTATAPAPEGKWKPAVKIEPPCTDFLKGEKYSPRPYVATAGDVIDDAPPPSSAMFADPEKMKEGVRQALLRPAYNVHDFYKKIGIWQYIARSNVFENFTLSVIGFNAIWMMIDTDNNDAATLLEAEPIFQIVEHAFCFYFTFEWFVRFMAFQRKRDGLQDGWFVFDSALVLMMVLETWMMTAIIAATGGGSSGGMGNTGILRLFRLLRLTRMARMLRSMPELMILIKGMVAATRSVFFTLCLLLIILYIFAIAFTQLCDGTEVGEIYFDSILASMYTLLIVGTFFDNLGDVLTDVGRAHFVYGALFMVFIALAALMVMNMLIGVLCEVVSAVAATEKEEMLVTFVRDKMEDVMSSLDQDGDRMISKAEFMKIMESHEAVHALEEVEVDAVGLVDMVDFIFDGDGDGEEDDEGPKELSIAHFLDVVLQLRGNNTATVKDVCDLRKFLGHSVKRLEARLHRKTTVALSQAVSTPTASVGRQTTPAGSVTPAAAGSVTPPELLAKPVPGEPISMKPPMPPVQIGMVVESRQVSSETTPTQRSDVSPSDLQRHLGHIDAFLSAGMLELQKMRNAIENPTSTGGEGGSTAERPAAYNKSAVSAQMTAVEEFFGFALAQIQEARHLIPRMSSSIASEQGSDQADIRLWMARLESFLMITGLNELHTLKDKTWTVSTGEESVQIQEHVAWISKVDEYLATSVAGLRRIRQGLVCELT